MEEQFLATLEQFIVHAKQATYVGNGQELLPYRLGSKDLQFKDGDFVKEGQTLFTIHLQRVSRGCRTGLPGNPWLISSVKSAPNV